MTEASKPGPAAPADMRAVVADLTYAVGELLVAVRTVDLAVTSLHGMVSSLDSKDRAAYEKFAEKVKDSSGRVDVALDKAFSSLVDVMSRVADGNG